MLILGSQCFPNYGLERFFRFASELGFDGVEIMVCDDYDTQNPAYLKELQERYKIKIQAFSLPNRNAEAYIDAFEKVVAEFAGTMVNLASSEILSFNYKRWMEVSVPRFVKRHRLQLNRRNTPFRTIFGIFPSRTESSLHDLRKAGDVSLDLSALWKSNQEIMQAGGFLSEKMQHVYLSNVHHGVMYSPVSLGILPVESFLTKLARENYRGDFTFKFNPETIHAGDDERMIKSLKESKEFFEKYFTFKPE